MNHPWVAIQRNPKSGSGRRRSQLLELISHLKHFDLHPRLFSSRQRMAAYLEDPKRRENLVCIVAAGGDGTVDDVINRFRGVRIAVLPLGTENVIARCLKLPRSGKDVAEMIRANHSRRIDLCTLGNRRFVVMASFGFDAEVVRRLHASRGGHIRKTDYLKPIWDSLRKYEYPELQIYVDDSETPLTGRMAIISNLPDYALRLPVARDAVVDDGLIDLRLFRNGSAFQMFRYFYKVATATHENLDDVQSVRAGHLRIESSKPVPIQIDGDPGGWTPVEIRVLPAELEILVPPKNSLGRVVEN